MPGILMEGHNPLGARMVSVYTFHMNESLESVPSLSSLEIHSERKEKRDAADLSVAAAYLAGVRGIESATIEGLRA